VPDLQSGLVLFPRFAPADLYFLTAQEAEELGNQARSEDIFAVHEQFLGKALSQCVWEHDGQVSLDTGYGAFFEDGGRDQARVVLSSSGVAGDAGLGERQYFLLLDGGHRERLTSSEEHYLNGQRAQQILRATRKATITNRLYYGGFNLGFDNRRMMPPFIPLLRGEDTAFEQLLRVASPDGLVAHVPRLVLHLCAVNKQRSGFQAKSAVDFFFSCIVWMMAQLLPQRPYERCAEKRFSAAGQFFIEIGSLPEIEFSKFLQRMYWTWVASKITEAERALELYQGKPDFWAKDLIAYIAECRACMSDDDAPIASDVIAAFGADAALRKQQQLVRQFGELVEVWPRLRAAALDLKRSEGSFGRRI
jgi:hypothetical protein